MNKLEDTGQHEWNEFYTQREKSVKSERWVSLGLVIVPVAVLAAGAVWALVELFS